MNQIIKFKSEEKLSDVAYDKIIKILAEEGVDYSELDFEKEETKYQKALYDIENFVQNKCSEVFDDNQDGTE